MSTSESRRLTVGHGFRFGFGVCLAFAFSLLIAVAVWIFWPPTPPHSAKVPSPPGRFVVREATYTHYDEEKNTSVKIGTLLKIDTETGKTWKFRSVQTKYTIEDGSVLIQGWEQVGDV